jgi:hypothetical protein
MAPLVYHNPTCCALIENRIFLFSARLEEAILASGEWQKVHAELKRLSIFADKFMALAANFVQT